MKDKNEIPDLVKQILGETEKPGARGPGVESEELFAPLDSGRCFCYSPKDLEVTHCVCPTQERVCRSFMFDGPGDREFSQAQRERLIDDAVYCYEGAVTREELEAVDDQTLAGEWLASLKEYVDSQIG